MCGFQKLIYLYSVKHKTLECILFDTFNNVVNKNSSIAIIDKFYYLRLCVKGETATIIQPLNGPSNQGTSLQGTLIYNYEITWLIERYDNRRFIINKYLQALFKLV
jgi:hypothetical protein